MSRQALANIAHVLAIASGKGGVGKTTVAVNLALALKALGARVGLFDADIFGPNVPLMLGVHRRKPGGGYVPVARPKVARAYIEPLERYGLKIMSMGLVVAEDQVINPLADAVGWIVVQTLRDVLWGRLDYLLVDLPPSAGQPQQGLIQNVAMDGVIIVTTPQDLSLLDSSRSLKLYADAGVPVLGLVENMSYFVCPRCGERHEVFQRSERWRPPALDDVPVLGRIPLAAEISKGIDPVRSAKDSTEAHRVDREHPLMADAKGKASPQAEVFLEIARAVRRRFQTDDR
jgi:ATP-binding protein involved in chromosome partitioning